MQHTFTTSADGSSTLQLTCYEETYHSRNGAYTEAMHIYIQCGLEHLLHNLIGTAAETAPCICGNAGNKIPENPLVINIYDVGFGTALNCILAWVWQQQLRLKGLPYPTIRYCGIEKYPIPLAEIENLNYPDIIAEHWNSTSGNKNLLPDSLSEIFSLIHNSPWEKTYSQGHVITSLCRNRPQIAQT